MRRIVPVALAVAVAATVAGVGADAVEVTHRWRVVSTSFASGGVGRAYDVATQHPDVFLDVVAARNQDNRVTYLILTGSEGPGEWEDEVALPLAGQTWRIERCAHPTRHYDRLAAEVSRPWSDGRRPIKRVIAYDPYRRHCHVAVTMPYDVVPAAVATYAYEKWGLDVAVRSRAARESRDGDAVAPTGDVIHDETIGGLYALPDDDPATFASVRFEDGDVVVVLGPGAQGTDWRARIRNMVSPYRWRAHRCPLTRDELNSLGRGYYALTWPSGYSGRSDTDFDVATCGIVARRPSWDPRDVRLLRERLGDTVRPVEGPLYEFST